MSSLSNAWFSISMYCKSQITDVAYKTWISRVKLHNIDRENKQAILLVPNDFHRQTLTRCYTSLLKDAVKNSIGNEYDIHFVTPEEVDENEIIEGDSNDTKPKVQKASIEFTFDNYIVGSSNKFAHAASLAVATNPAGAYNPLFIYGNSGLGKTHLLYAIANDIRKNHKDMKITYVKGEDFTNELIESLSKATMANFRQKYRKTDVLLVDDVHFIGGKEATQEEFFHTFNTLYESKKQIVLTSDRPPREIKTLEDRIRTRFEWGLLADVQAPDIETRIAIIKSKADAMNIDITDEICEYIADKLKTNVRQLEGVVKKIKAKSILAGEKMTLNIANEAIKDVIVDLDMPKPMTVEIVIDEVARTFGVTPENLRSLKNKKALLAHARQIAIYIVREITHLPMTKIGEEFGGRHYSTIVYTIKQVEKEMEVDPKTKSTVEDIIKNIKGL